MNIPIPNGDRAPEANGSLREKSPPATLRLAKALGKQGRDPDAFVTDNLMGLAAQRGLVFPRHVLAPLVAALDSGKHIMLTGAPGSGKTSLAFLVAELAKRSVRCNGYLATTATTDWDINQTIGRYYDTPEGPVFREGFILEAIQKGRWLIIDEMNRADFDKAFGPLFTIFANQPVTLPFKRVGHSSYLSLVPAGAETPPQTEAVVVPTRWRIIATMNELDKATLYRMSFALMRRFAFIEVEPPDDDVLVDLMGGDDQIAKELLVLRQFVDLGAGVFIEAANYARRRSADGDATPSRVLFETFYAFFLRQLHLLDEDQARLLTDCLEASFDKPEALRLRQVLRDVLEQADFAPFGRSMSRLLSGASELEDAADPR
jgi:energy-coupling factor transporter ATP-binding protein EcfA2